MTKFSFKSIIFRFCTRDTNRRYINHYGRFRYSFRRRY